MTTAREQAIEVMAQTRFDKYYYAWSNILSCCHSEEQHRSHMMETAREDARLALDALLTATQEQTCPTCSGRPMIENPAVLTGVVMVPTMIPCPDCTDGVVPGTEPLVLLRPERVGWHAEGRFLRKTEGDEWTARKGWEPVYRRAGSPDA